jgi:hypothetical protein
MCTSPLLAGVKCGSGDSASRWAAATLGCRNQPRTEIGFHSQGRWPDMNLTPSRLR